MKSAEQMMCDWIQSQLDENQKFTINSEQYLEIWNWFQSVQLAQEKAEYMGYKKNKPDGNHAEIRDGLRQAGYVVKDCFGIIRLYYIPKQYQLIIFRCFFLCSSIQRF